jgi:hypothetical protein
VTGGAGGVKPGVGGASGGSFSVGGSNPGGGAAGASGGSTSGGAAGSAAGGAAGSAGSGGSAGTPTGGNGGTGGDVGGAGGTTGGAGGTTGGAGGTTGGAGGTTGGTGGDGGLPNFGGFGGKTQHQFANGPSVSSRGFGFLDVFAPGKDGFVYQKSDDENSSAGWQPGWTQLGSYIISDVDSTSWGPTRIDIVGMGMDNNVNQKYFEIASWSPWVQLTNTSDWKYGPTVASAKPNSEWVFMVGANDHLWWRFWNGTGWQGPNDLDANTNAVWTASPDAMSQMDGTTHHTYVVALGNNATIYIDHNQMVPGVSSSWTGWKGLPLPAGGGGFDSAPTICSMKTGYLDVFARKSADQHLWHTASTDGGKTWAYGWQDLGGVLASAPDCTSWTPPGGAYGRVDVVALGTNYHVFRISRDGWQMNFGWNGWEDLGVY